jgi:hypothetical protein
MKGHNAIASGILLAALANAAVCVPVRAEDNPPAATTVKKPPSAAHQALTARRRACGAEWKADKAAGKVVAGMKGPQYWSDCNKRKKAEAQKG